MATTARIPFTPRWQGVEGLAVKIVSKYFGMLCAEHEFDDLMQEAYLVYMNCKRAAPHIDKQKWFTVYFGNALRNKLLKLAAKCGRTISLEEMQDAPEQVAPDDPLMEAFLRELPQAVKDLMHVVCFGSGSEGRAAYRTLQQMLPSLS